MLNSRVNFNWGLAFNVRTSNAIGMHRAMMLAAMAPLLAGCAMSRWPPLRWHLPASNWALSTVRPQARAIIRELPGRIAPTRVPARPRARLRYHRRAPVPAGNRSDGRRSTLPDRPQTVRGRVAGERQAALDKAMAALDLARRSMLGAIVTLTAAHARRPEAENEKPSGRSVRRRPRSAAAGAEVRARQTQS
mgnify:CR=1 FL=1